MLSCIFFDDNSVGRHYIGSLLFSPHFAVVVFSEISFIKKAKEQQEAEARRQATPVVGDMRPLADALPELCHLIGPAAAPASSCRKSRKNKT